MVSLISWDCWADRGRNTWKKIYNVSFVVTNTAKQSVTRMPFVFEFCHKMMAIQKPDYDCDNSTFVNDTNNLAQAEKKKIRLGGLGF